MKKTFFFHFFFKEKKIYLNKIKSLKEELNNKENYIKILEGSRRVLKKIWQNKEQFSLYFIKISGIFRFFFKKKNMIFSKFFFNLFMKISNKIEKNIKIALHPPLLQALCANLYQSLLWPLPRTPGHTGYVDIPLLSLSQWCSCCSYCDCW